MLPSLLPLVALLFSSYFHPSSLPMRLARWPCCGQALAGTRASVSRICPRQGRPATCCQARMKKGVLAGYD